MNEPLAADLAIAAAFVNAERARDGDRDEQSLDAAVQAFRRSLERDGWAVAQALTPERLAKALAKWWASDGSMPGTGSWEADGGWSADAAAILAALASTEEPRHE